MTNDQFATYQKLITDIRECMLVTDDPSVGLRSRPMSCSKCDDDGNLWFFTKMTSDKVQEIYHDRNVNCAFQKPGDNQYVSVSGKARLVDNPGLKKSLYSPFLDAWFDGPTDPQATLICVDAVAAEYWNDSDSKLVSFAKIAATALVGAEYDAPETEKLTFAKDG